MLHPPELPRLPLLRPLLLLLALSMTVPVAVLARPASHRAPACVATPTETQAALPRSFLGHACRDDRCGSHKAGFDWAERNNITDPRACVTRNDPAFIEGCRVYAGQAVTAEQAGFEWARQNELADPCQCAGAGMRFEAGCQAYVDSLAD